MAYLRRSVDSVNSEIQFEVVESCAGVNLKFNDSFENADLDLIKVRVEKITKNQPDQTLYSCTVSDLKKILKFAFPALGQMLPFAIGKNLELNDDNKIVVTLDLKQVETAKIPTSFEFELNKHIDSQKNPLLIKKVTVDEELSFSTELYQLLLVSQDVQSYETMVLKTDSFGVAQPTKVFFGSSMIKSIKPIDSIYHVFVTAGNQDVTIKGTSTNYLIAL